MLEISQGAGLQWMTPRGHSSFIFDKVSAAPWFFWVRKVAPLNCSWIMGELKIILQCGTSEGLTSEAQGQWVFWAVLVNHCPAELLQKVVKGALNSFCVKVCRLCVCCICVPPHWNPSSGRSAMWKSWLLWGQTCGFFLLWCDTAVPSSGINCVAGAQTGAIRPRSMTLEGWQMGRCWEMPRTWAHTWALCRSHFTSDRSNTHY